MKIAIVSTHPIQYHTPWFRQLAAQEHVDLRVYYALLPDERQQGVGFGEAFAWDIPLLEGYDWELLPNKRKSPSLTGFFQSSTPAIYSRLADSRPDVVILTGWQSLPLLQALWAAVRLGLPCIVRGESNGLRPRPLLMQAFHRLLFSRFKAFLAIGKLNRQFYREYDIPAERIFQANYFIENRRFEDQFERDRVERTALRDAWNIPEGHTCFAYVGKLEPKKRIMDLLRALELACGGRPRTGRLPSPVSGLPSSPVPGLRSPVSGLRSPVPGLPSIHLLVAGTGELMEEARAFAAERQLPVTFAGFLNQTEITRAYAAADCLVLPSDYGETWGLVVNEGMACGLPAIVSDRVGCGPDLVEEGVTGSVFPCGDVEALASKLVILGSDPEKLVRMGAQARQRVSAYSVEHAVEGTMRAIEFVVGEDRRRTDDRRPATDDGRRSPVVSRPSLVSGPRSSLKILHVIPSLSPKDGGPSFAMPLIAKGLELSGVQVDVATTQGAHEPRLDQGEVRVFYFRRQSEFYKVSFPLSQWLSRHIRDYDLVHIHALFSYSSYSAARLARENGVPYIVRPLGVLNRWGMQNRRRLLKRFSFRLIEQPIVRNAAAIHYTSQQEKLEAEETGVRTGSVVIPLGIDLSVFQKLPDPERFYDKFPDARGREIILFLSRLNPKKGLDLLLRAFAESDGRRETGDGRQGTGDGRRMTGDGRPETGDGRQKTGDRRQGTGDGRRMTGDGRPETGDGRQETAVGLRSHDAGPRSPVPGPQSPVPGLPSPVSGLPSPVPGPLLVIAGEGDDQFVAGLRRLAEELGIAGEVLWTGFLGGDDKLSAMAAASLFVLPSYSENFGIALVEAMAAGLPCVMSDQVGIAVDVKEYDAGMVTTCEVGSLASAMQRLLYDSEVRRRLGANARRLVDERFSLEAMSNSLVKLYDRVLSSQIGEPLEGFVVPPLGGSVS